MTYVSPLWSMREEQKVPECPVLTKIRSVITKDNFVANGHDLLDVASEKVCSYDWSYS